ncbi:hypothetical protein MRY82_09895 [bacterium]|nr:hypothetical protein [bacterium]
MSSLPIFNQGVFMGTSLQEFAQKNNIVGLGEEALEAIIKQEQGYTLERAQQFLSFHQRIEHELLNHPIITHNAYTSWFEKGEANTAQVKDLIIQFSVFSNLFLHAQLHKVINSDSIESMRASKEILVNELGVIFRPREKKLRNETQAVSNDYDDAKDPALLSPEGTVDGGTFRFSAAHFEWMVRIAESLGLGFNDIGKRKHGCETTLFFCDELVRIYGSEDYETSQAASYAVENWAARGFWKQLIRGLQSYKEKHNSKLSIGFFTYHDRLEAQHADHTQDELEEYYFENPHLNEDAFIQNGNQMLKAVQVFWDGLEKRRKNIESSPA